MASPGAGAQSLGCPVHWAEAAVEQPSPVDMPPRLVIAGRTPKLRDELLMFGYVALAVPYDQINVA
jgi:hypothetical protein